MDQASLSVSSGDQGGCTSSICINAVGAKNVNMAFRKYMERGSAIVDVASCAAYDLPDIAVHHGVFELAEYHEDEFVQKTLSEVGFALAAIADERNSFLAGVDVIVDGGGLNGKQFLS